MCKENLTTASLEVKLKEIEAFVQKIKASSTLSEKLDVVNSESTVEAFLGKYKAIESIFSHVKPEDEFILKVLIVLGQGPLFFEQMDTSDGKIKSLRFMLQKLQEVENFYAFMGGLAGYYLSVMTLIVEKHSPNKESLNSSNEKYYRPGGLDISADEEARRAAVRWGIESLPLLAQICPIGGAGDRLNLVEETTGDQLPVAYLKFGGFSLLESLVRDLQAIEFLYWKIYHKQLVVPVALMTSEEKNNDEQIKALCEKLAYFGRKSENFRQFMQPLVPVITQEGDFALSEPLKLVLKPGGHGVVWRLAIENNIFSWFKSLGKEKLLIRQINNPIAATDAALLAFVGVGKQQQRTFGFLSCDRLIGAAEGMLVIKETQANNLFSYCIMNIEYTDFTTKGLKDAPKEEGSEYGIYPANTNILFADIEALNHVISEVPVPGMIINMKSKFLHMEKDGTFKSSHGGRLESMMQNISESIVDTFPQKMEDSSQMHSFVIYEKRQKVISVTKNQFQAGKSINETPEGCFYDQMHNCYDLLRDHCRMNIPMTQTKEEFIQRGPSLILRYHPSLGPLYEVIAQKLRGGNLAFGSELCLEISEITIENLALDGSLHILAKDLLGHKNQEGVVCYSHQNGKCELKNVSIVNKGINREAENSYWKNEITRHEQLEIILHGNAEFSACDVLFEGSIKYAIPSGQRTEVTMQDGKIHYRHLKISEPTWQWHYAFDEQNRVILNYPYPLDKL